MSIKFDPELVRFSQFVSEKIGAGSGDLSPEEALDLWRSENPSDDERADTVRALKEALDEFRAGDSGIPLAEFDREFRERRGFDRT